ncbi:replication-relaxation family protein [Alicyclobacillus macrosporangiidus]|uniref:replication-relaxation family protein n=1 Tax=Alicyclobacillus macrosporangiidus TaxID=392015 RepID=UPI0004980A80|nr:replication-relaxation family protein [Alicyclobacillus macrosporangiidus]
MILQWRDSDFAPEQQLLGVVFDAGVILRDDLLFLLGWSVHKLKRNLRRLRTRHAEPLIRGVKSSENHHMYLLTQEGVRYAHQMLGIEVKAVTMEAQMNHALGLNAILMRYVRAHGVEGVRWFNTREAADELWFLRKLVTGESDVDLRGTAIRPDAILRTATGFWWIEYDNATENSRQIWRKYQMYVTNLASLDDSFRHVVWVTKTDSRRGFLETIWRRVDHPDVHMSFYKETEEVF